MVARNSAVFVLNLGTTEFARYFARDGASYLSIFLTFAAIYFLVMGILALPFYERLGGAHRKDLGLWDSLRRVFLPLVELFAAQTWIISTLRHTLSTVEKSFIEDYLFFLAISLGYELIFDFYFYWFHRFCHTWKRFYEFSHAYHHTYTYVNALLTFDMDIFELLFTQLVPGFVFLYFAGPSINERQLWWLMFYKLYIEIAGHSGYAAAHCSFPQSILPLSEVCGITLYGEDHDMHHTHYKVNYSKRFSIWDKLFGTYAPSIGLPAKAA